MAFVGPSLGMEAGHVVIVIGRHPEGVETEGVLTGPADRRVALSTGFDGRLGDSGPRTEDKSGNRRHGNATEQAVGPDPFHTGIVQLEATVLEIKRCPSVLCGGQRF